MSDGKPKQLLHLVIGGELEAIDGISFKDLDRVELVGVFPNYASAYAVWKQKAQMTVDNAEMRYFIVHLHRLLDPQGDLTEVSVDDQLPPPRFFIDQPWLRKFLGAYVIGGYSRLVFATSRAEYFPPDYLDNCRRLEPAIYIAWHANLLATPLMAPDLTRLVNLTSPHPDGRMAGALSEAFGITTISAAGASSRQAKASGGIAGFRGLLRALKSGKSVFLAAEVPPEPGRRIAPGIVPLARLSGRPIIAVAAASTRRSIIERLWDKNQIHHPFSRFAVVGTPPFWPISARTDADAEAQLKQSLDAAYAEALERTARR